MQEDQTTKRRGEPIHAVGGVMREEGGITSAPKLTPFRKKWLDRMGGLAAVRRELPAAAERYPYMWTRDDGSGNAPCFAALLARWAGSDDLLAEAVGAACRHLRSEGYDARWAAAEVVDHWFVRERTEAVAQAAGWHAVVLPFDAVLLQTHDGATATIPRGDFLTPIGEWLDRHVRRGMWQARKEPTIPRRLAVVFAEQEHAALFRLHFG